MRVSVRILSDIPSELDFTPRQNLRRRLYLIRHGESLANAYAEKNPGKHLPVEDPCLSTRGVSQGRELY